jgi:hypothetical protein
MGRAREEGVDPPGDCLITRVARPPAAARFSPQPRRGRYLVYNYTSPLDGPDEPWGTALLHGPTLIYRTTLVFY